MKVTDALSRYTAESGADQAGHARRYFEWLAVEGGQADADAVFSRYLRHLEQEGRKPGTVDLARRSVRAFFSYAAKELRLGVRVPRAKGFAFDPKDSDRPALSPDLIARLVGAAKAGGLTARQTSLLALSTTFGPRANELAALRQTDVDRVLQRVYWRVSKHGHNRWQWLPPEVRPWLQEEFVPCDAGSVQAQFGAIWGAVVEGERPDRTAWHALRRALVRDLVVAGVSRPAVGRFMRWAGTGASGAEKMVEWYSQPNLVVGEDGEAEAEEVDEGTEEFDGEVWDRHPYLSLWA